MFNQSTWKIWLSIALLLLGGVLADRAMGDCDRKCRPKRQHFACGGVGDRTCFYFLAATCQFCPGSDGTTFWCVNDGPWLSSPCSTSQVDGNGCFFRSGTCPDLCGCEELNANTVESSFTMPNTSVTVDQMGCAVSP